MRPICVVGLLSTMLLTAICTRAFLDVYERKRKEEEVHRGPSLSPEEIKNL